MKVVTKLLGVVLLLIAFTGGVLTAPFLDKQEYTMQDNTLTTFSKSINFEQPTLSGLERPSPKDRIKEQNIEVYEDKLVIYVNHPLWAKFTDTNSMDPILDVGANALQVQPKATSDIQVGDIISYTHSSSDGTIIHRVIEIGNDEDGWYAIAKGDNNTAVDPGKIRFHQIKKVLFGIIY